MSVDVTDVSSDRRKDMGVSQRPTHREGCSGQVVSDRTVNLVSPSSLIFVVVLLIWATYLSLHVARRREQLSTARSVDRFSAHMRVLQRRSVKPVERSVPASSGSTRTSILAAGALESRADVADPATSRRTRPASRALQATSALSGPARSTKLSSAPGESRPARPAPVPGQVRSSRAFAAWACFTGMLTRANMRRVRAYGLLVSLVAGAATFVAAVVGAASLAVPTGFAAMSFALLAWLRHDRRVVLAARARHENAQLLAAERARMVADRAAQQESQALTRAAEAAEAARPVGPQMPVAQEHVAPRERAPFDLTAYDEARAAYDGRAIAPAADALVAERSWEPVPVPAPTYTMKARAEHPFPGAAGPGAHRGHGRVRGGVLGRGRSCSRALIDPILRMSEAL